MKKNTSWGNVAEWYTAYLNDPDNYQAQVILPNLLRIMEITSGEKILDLACGSGFFSKSFIEKDASVMGVDISPELIAQAKALVPSAHFIVSPAHDLSVIKGGSIDKIVIVLAIQNIKEAKEVFAECAQVLKPGGKIYVVMNHPIFRIPKGSSWEWDKDGKQYRRIDYYLSEKTLPIDMEPGKTGKKNETISFHRSLQYYFKLLTNSGFAVSRLEEWISHKKSQAGPRQKEEDRMRKEIPLFLFLEAKKQN
jgi:ubiquinone/menaquinone biosynthesis C-methylase UbiE